MFDTRHVVFSMTSLKFLQTKQTTVVILEPAEDIWREQQCGIKSGVILSQPQETGLPLLLVSFKNDQQVNNKKGGKG